MGLEPPDPFLSRFKKLIGSSYLPSSPPPSPPHAHILLPPPFHLLPSLPHPPLFPFPPSLFDPPPTPPPSFPLSPYTSLPPPPLIMSPLSQTSFFFSSPPFFVIHTSSERQYIANSNSHPSPSFLQRLMATLFCWSPP